MKMHRSSASASNPETSARAKTRKPSVLLGSIALLAASATALLMPSSGHAATLYWDLNGAAANVAGAVTGAWNGTNLFWNDAASGTGGTPVAVTTAFDDLVFSSGALYTAGTVTASGGRVASSITFEDNIALTLAGAVTVGGAGAKSGIFVLTGDNAANIVSAAVTLGANSTIQNAGTGVLSITGGVTGAFNLALQNNGATASGVTVSTGSLNNAGTVTNSGTGAGSTLISAVIGTSVLSVTQSSATSALTLSGANTYLGKTVVSAGTLSFNTIGNVGATSSALGAPTTVADGTIDLAGNLTYTGGAASSDRVINLTNGAGGVTINNIGTGALTLTGGITGASTNILFRGTGNITESGVIAGTITGTVSHTDGGTLFLSNAANAFTGGLLVSNGTISIDSIADSGIASAAGAGSVITLGQSGFSNTGKLQFTGAGGGSSNRAISILSNAAIVSGGIIENTVVGQTLTLSGGVSLGVGVGSVPSLQLIGAGNGEMSGNIVGTGLTITKSGTGAWTLSGASNTYTGGTTLSAGILNLNSTTAIGAAAGIFTITGGTLDSTGAGAVTLANNNPLRFNGNFAFTGTRDLNLGTGGVILNAARTITADAGTLTVGGGITGATFGITKAGAGTLSLGGVIATTTGGLTVNAGTLIVGNAANTFTGNVAIAGATAVLQMTSGSNGNATSAPLGIFTGGTAYKTVTLTNGGTFRPMANYNVNVPTAALPGNGYVFSIGTGGGTFDVGTGVTFTLDDGTGAGTATTNTQLQGAGTLTKTGNGTLSLGNAATSNAVFTGQILVNQGILKLGAMTATGVGLGSTGANTVIAAGAAFDINNNASTAAEPVTINGTGVGGGNVIFTSNAAGGSFAGPITLGTSSTIGSTTAGTLTFAAGATFALGANTLTISNNSTGRVFTDGIISGGGNLVMNSSGTGDYVPRTGHTYSGGTTLTAGFVAVDVDSVGTPGSPTAGGFGTGLVDLAGAQLRSSTTAARTVGNTVTLSADTTFYTAASEKSLTFSGPVTITGGTRTLTSTVGTTVSGASVVFSGAIGDGGNALGLIKAGLGNLRLGGVNTYTGGTTVNAGVLNLTGSLAANTALTVAADSTFSMASGAANPLPTVSALDLGAGGGTTTLVFDLGANTAGSDSITTANAVTRGNPTAIQIAGIAGFGGAATYDLITALSGLNGGPAYALTSAPGGFTYALNISDTLVQLGVTAAAGTGSLYWGGGVNNSWSGLSGLATNWFTDPAGAFNAGYNPTAGNTVIFSTTSATGPTLATTLDNNYTVNDLQFNSNPAGVTAVSIAPGIVVPGVLTVAPASSAAGIAVGANAGAVTISAPVVLGASQTWSADGTGVNGSALTVSGAISGVGANTLTIGGLVTLSAPAGANTYSGPTTVGNGAILRSGATNSFSASSAVAVNGTGILRLNGFSNTIPTVSGNGTLENGSAATAVTLTVGDANNAIFSGIVQNGAAATLGIIKTGAGILELSGANTYAGVTTVREGTLTLSGARTGASGIISVSDTAGLSATLNITNGILALGAGRMNVGNAATTAAIGTVNQSGGALSFTGSDALLLGQNSVANQGIYNLSGGSITTFASATRGIMLGVNTGAFGGTFNLSGTGVLNMTLASGGTGDGVLMIGRSDAAAGNTTNVFAQTGGTANVGILSMGGNGATSTGVSSTLTLTGGVFAANQFARLAAGNTNTAVMTIGGTADVTLPAFPTLRGTSSTATLTFDGGSLTPLAASATYLGGLTNAFITNNGATLNVPATRDITISQLLEDAVAQNGTLTKLGLGTLTLTGANAYTGGTFVNAGTLAVGANNALPATGAVDVNGGTLDLLTFTTPAGAVTLQSGAIQGSTGVLSATSYDLRSGSARALGGAVGISKNTGGTVTLSGANTFSGAVTVAAGTLQFSAADQLGDNSATNTVALNGGVLSYTGAGAVDIGVNRVLTLGGGALNAANSTGALTVSGGIAVGSTSNLTKTGSGTVIIPGTSSWNGGASSVIVSGGTLQAGFGAAGVSAVNVGASGNLRLVNSTIEALTLGNSAGALTLSGGGRLGFEINGLTNDSIAVGATGTALTGGAITLDFFNFGAGVAAGTYNLLTAPSGLAGGTTYLLGSAPNGFNYTINTSDTLISLTATAYTPIYWRGGQDLSWNTLGAASANWTSDATGLLDSAHLPLPAETVIFSAIGAPTSGNTITTTLDAAFTIDSLQFNSVPAGITAVTINPGAGGTLTLSPVSTSGGIRVLNSGGAATIAAPLTVGAGQTWDVDPSGSLTISGNTVFNAAVSKTNTGVLTLSGNNSGSGAVTLAGGTLKIDSATALGTGTFTIGAGTTIDSTTGVTLTNNNVQNWNGNFSFTGTQALNLGTGAVTLGTSAVVTTTANTLTVGGAIGDGGNGRSLTKAGAGTLVLTGANNYGGLTTVNAGTLTLNGTQAGAGGVTLSAGSLNVNHPNALGTGALVINGGTIGSTGGGLVIVATNNAQSWNGSFTFDGTQDLNLGTGAVALGVAPTVTLTAANTLTVGGNITGGFGLTVSGGAGTLLLSGANTYTGTTSISGGTLKLGSAAAVPAGSLSSMSGNGVLDLNGFGLSIVNLAASAATNTITNEGAVNSTLTVTNLSTAIGAFISDGATNSVALQVANNNLGTAMFTNAANDFSGGLTLLNSVNGTRLSFGTITGTPYGLGVITIGQAATDKAGFYFATAGQTLVNDVVMNTALGTDRPGIRVDGTGTIMTGTLTANLAPATFSTNGTGVVSLNGQVTGPNGLTLDNVNGTSITVILAADNNYAGTTTIGGAKGILRVGAGGTTGTFGTGAVSNAGALIFDRSDTYTLAAGNLVTGAGSVTIAGGAVATVVDNQFVTTGVLNMGVNGSATTVTLDSTLGSVTFGSMTSQTNSASANFVTIGAGETITINGNVSIGNTVSTGQLGVTALTFNGGGSLVVTAAAGTFEVGRNIGTTNNSAKAIVDLSSLANFTASLGTGTLAIQPNGDNSGGNAASTLTLSNTANSITATTINIGPSSTGAVQTVNLGGGTNVIQADTINLGTGARDSGKLKFLATGGSVSLRDRAGTGRTNVTMGPTTAQGTGYTTASLFDTTGNTADLAIGTLAIDLGAKTAANTNDFRFDAGTLDIRTVNMAVAKGTGSSVNTMTIGGGTVKLGGSAAFGDLGTGTVSLAAAASGELAITGGVVTSSVDITKTAGTGTAILTLDGGTLDMTGKNIGGAVAIDTLNFRSGTLQNVAEINAGATGLTKTTPGTLVLAGTMTYTGTTIVSDGVLNVTTALGNGANIVNANATTNFTVSQTLGALNIGTVPFAELSGESAFAASGGPDIGAAVVPEPGSIGLLMVGALGVLSRRRRPAAR